MDFANSAASDNLEDFDQHHSPLPQSSTLLEGHPNPSEVPFWQDECYAADEEFIHKIREQTNYAMSNFLDEHNSPLYQSSTLLDGHPNPSEVPYWQGECSTDNEEYLDNMKKHVNYALSQLFNPLDPKDYVGVHELEVKDYMRLHPIEVFVIKKYNQVMQSQITAWSNSHNVVIEIFNTFARTRHRGRYPPHYLSAKPVRFLNLETPKATRPVPAPRLINRPRVTTPEKTRPIPRPRVTISPIQPAQLPIVTSKPTTSAQPPIHTIQHPIVTPQPTTSVQPPIQPAQPPIVTPKPTTSAQPAIQPAQLPIVTSKPTTSAQRPIQPAQHPIVTPQPTTSVQPPIQPAQPAIVTPQPPTCAQPLLATPNAQLANNTQSKAFASTRYHKVDDIEQYKIIDFECSILNNPFHKCKTQKNDTVYKCLACGIYLTTSFNCKRHVETKGHKTNFQDKKSKINRFPCQMCAFTCDSKVEIQTHEMQKHPDATSVHSMRIPQVSDKQKAQNKKEEKEKKRKEKDDKEMKEREEREEKERLERKEKKKERKYKRKMNDNENDKSKRAKLSGGEESERRGEVTEERERQRNREREEREKQRKIWMEQRLDE